MLHGAGVQIYECRASKEDPARSRGICGHRKRISRIVRARLSAGTTRARRGKPMTAARSSARSSHETTVPTPSHPLVAAAREPPTQARSFGKSAHQTPVHGGRRRRSGGDTSSRAAAPCTVFCKFHFTRRENDGAVLGYFRCAARSDSHCSAERRSGIVKIPLIFSCRCGASPAARCSPVHSSDPNGGTDEVLLGNETHEGTGCPRCRCDCRP